MANNYRENVTRAIRAFSTGFTDIQELNDELAPIMWESDRISDQDVRKMVYETELGLAEYSAGHVSADELRNEFKSLCAYQFPVASSSNVTLPAFATFVGTAHSMGSLCKSSLQAVVRSNMSQVP
jgi:hypothetical protein